jgi:N-acetylneuraminate synthase/N,N'-diacetyllegionaminate synthase
LPAGERLKPEDIMWVRPGEGLAPGSEALVLGKRLKRPIAQGELLALGDLE